MKTEIWINPYGVMFSRYNKLYKHTLTRIFKKPCRNITCRKSVCKDESPDRDKKDDKDIGMKCTCVCNPNKLHRIPLRQI